MRSGVHETSRDSGVRLDVSPILHFDGFAAVGPAGRRYPSIAARHACCRRGRLSIHIHSSTAVSSNCEPCHVYREVWKLNTELLSHRGYGLVLKVRIVVKS